MGQGLDYTVDIVMCIDVTASMSPHIERVKQHAIQFHEDLQRQMRELDKHIRRLRVKIVAFRDYHERDERPMEVSPFFTFPADNAKFASFVNGLKVEGGGDEPETALEALTYAIRSEWTREGAKQRHVIVVFTDASAHPLEKTPKPAEYPSDMPKNFIELSDLWNGPGMRPGSQRLVLFAPDAYPWNKMADYWRNAIHYPARAADGLAEQDYGVIINLIVRSI